MQPPINEHNPKYVERPVAMVKARLTRLLRIPEAACIAEPRRKAHVAIPRAQKLAAT